MLQCLSFNTSSASSSSASPAANVNHNQNPSSLNGNLVGNTPGTSVGPSPNTEYIRNIQTSSFMEMMWKIHPADEDDATVKYEYENDEARMELLDRVLYPNRESVSEALRNAKSSVLTCLVSDYFKHSERTSNLCLLICRSIYRARKLYAPVGTLLEVLCDDSQPLSKSQCNWAFEVFVQFDRFDNPFPCPDSHNFDEMRSCFTQLKQQLDNRLCKSRSRMRMVRCTTAGSAICLIGTTVVVAVSAVVITVHALAALAAATCLPVNFPREYNKRECAHVAQLDAASKGTYVINNDLATIDRLVARLHTGIEGDKLLVRLGLERGKERHRIQEVIKQLCKNHSNFMTQLDDLEEHICLCFNTVNKARSLLFEEIRLHQTGNL